MRIKSILITIFCVLCFSECQKTSESESQEEEQQQNSNNLLLGDWIFEINDFSGAINQVNGTIYRFKDNGTVLIGYTYNYGWNFFNENLPEYAFNSAIKFFYKSNWSINNNQLSINGDFISVSTSLDNIDNKTIILDKNIKSPTYLSSHATQRKTFHKIEDLSAYEKIIDLTALEATNQDLSGIWKLNNPDVIYELQNGRVIKWLVYNQSTDSFDDITDVQALQILQTKFTLQNQEYQDQKLYQKINKSSYDIYGTNFQVFEHQILDINKGNDGKINFIYARHPSASLTMIRLK